TSPLPVRIASMRSGNSSRSLCACREADRSLSLNEPAARQLYRATSARFSLRWSPTLLPCPFASWLALSYVRAATASPPAKTSALVPNRVRFPPRVACRTIDVSPDPRYKLVRPPYLLSTLEDRDQP